MRKATVYSILFLLVLMAWGCAARSISNSGYPGDYSTRNSEYRGELSEYDVLGVADSRAMTDDEIRKALDDRKDLRIPKGSTLIVIQSGAMAPDGAMLDEISKYFKIVPLSGFPVKEKESESFARKLRSVAANGGCSHVLCYWGTLETAQEDKVTKAISWVPIAGSFVPDESQHMRINLRAALVDVASGRWTMIRPDPIDDSALSAKMNRVSSDQKQVELLKKKGYAVLASELSRYFTQ